MKPAALIKIISFFALTTSLMGCSSYSSKFDCPYGEGLGCASVSKVNKMLDAEMVDIEDRVGSSQSNKQIPIYFGPARPLQMITINRLPVI